MLHNVEKGLIHIAVYIVVGVDKANVFASGNLKTRVSCWTDACVAFVNYSYSAVLGGVVVANLRAAVGRPVIYQNNFDIFQ